MFLPGDDADINISIVIRRVLPGGGAERTQ